MIHLLAAFAEHEREQISQRTKEALAAAKARGVELGKNGKVLARQNQEKAATFANGMAKTIRQLRNEGFTTVRQIVEELNRQKVPSATGAKWHVPTVHRLLRRLDLIAA